MERYRLHSSFIPFFFCWSLCLLSFGLCAEFKISTASGPFVFFLSLAGISVARSCFSLSVFSPCHFLHLSGDVSIGRVWYSLSFFFFFFNSLVRFAWSFYLISSRFLFHFFFHLSRAFRLVLFVRFPPAFSFLLFSVFLLFSGVRDGSVRQLHPRGIEHPLHPYSQRRGKSYIRRTPYKAHAS